MAECINFVIENERQQWMSVYTVPRIGEQVFIRERNKIYTVTNVLHSINGTQDRTRQGVEVYLTELPS